MCPRDITPWVGIRLVGRGLIVVSLVRYHSQSSSLPKIFPVHKYCDFTLQYFNYKFTLRLRDNIL